jgi:YVTN family beta-propeller protein
VAVSIALALAFGAAPGASAATLTNAWGAKIGSSGANGAATISAFTTGTGSIALKLAKLKPSTLLPVTLTNATCTGATLTSVAAIKSTSAGAAARTSTLTATQVALIKTATKATGKIAIKIGTGTTAKCGVFAAQPVPAYLAATLTVGDPYPEGMAISPSGVWVAGYYNGELTRFDPITNSVLSRFELDKTTENLAPVDLTFSEGSLWVAVDEYDSGGSTQTGVSIRRVDPTSGQSIAKVTVGSDISGIAASPGALWVTSFQDGTLKRIDTATNQVTATVNIGPGLSGVAFGEGSVWVSNETSGAVSRVDPTTNQITTTIPTVGLPQGVVAGGGAIWVSNWGTDNQPDGVLSRIDPATNQVTQTISVGTNPAWISFGGGSIWVSLFGEASVVRVNAATKAVQKISTGILTLGTDGKPVGLRRIVATDSAVWVVQRLPAPNDTTLPPEGRLFRINF